MRFLCPFCTKDNQTIDVPEGASGAVCPACSRRYRLRSVQAARITSVPRGEGLLYTIYFQKDGRPHLERFSSKTDIALQKDHHLLLVRQGRAVLGIADQTRSYWFPVFPLENNRPLLRAMLLSLVWPISLLVLLQALRVPSEAAQLLSNPLGMLAAFFFVAIFAGAPLLLWTMRTLFPYGPRRERIRGFDPRL